jgi:hypothetical protein
MMKIAMSAAAGAILRALAARAAVDPNRILLTDAHSTDWRSLTFSGERHHLSLKVTGPHSAAVVSRMCGGLEHVEFSIPGIIVADIGLIGSPRRTPDGATEIIVEALTVADD